jgi:hypothetical protein
MSSIFSMACWGHGVASIYPVMSCGSELMIRIDSRRSARKRGSARKLGCETRTPWNCQMNERFVHYALLTAMPLDEQVKSRSLTAR